MVQPMGPTSLYWTRAPKSLWYHRSLFAWSRSFWKASHIMPDWLMLKQHSSWRKRQRPRFSVVRRSRPCLFWRATPTRESVWFWRVEMPLTSWSKASASSWDNLWKSTVGMVTPPTLALRAVEILRPTRSRIRWMACFDQTTNEMDWKSGMVIGYWA